MAKRTKKRANRAGKDGNPPASATATARGEMPPERGLPWYWYAALFLLALGIRIAYLLELEASPIASLTLGDAESYHTWAVRLAGGDWVGTEVFYQAPLYPYFLGLQYALFGESLFVARLSQAVLGAGSAVLLALAGGRWLRPAQGLVAGAIFAAFAPAVFFVGLIQKTTLAVFLLCALLWVLSRSRGRLAPHDLFVAGALVGALALTRENALLFLLPLGIWIALEPGPTRAARIRAALAFTAGIALLLAPVIARNYAVGGELHLTTSQMGPNLYIGNNPDSHGYYRPIREGRQDTKFERADAQAFAEAEVGRALTPAEVSSFYVDRVLDYVRSQPLDWLRLMGRKLALVWNATEVGDTEDLYAFASHFSVLDLTLPLHFGLLFPLAVIGVAVTWHRRERLYLLYALIGVYAASVAVFYVFARYRFPLVPMVLLFAAAALTDGLAWLRRLTPRARLGALLAAALALVASNWPLVSRDDIQATTHYNLAHGLARDGNDEAALAEFARALGIEPDFAMARSERAVVLERMGRRKEAIEETKRAVADAPDDAVALANLGELLLDESRAEEAEPYFARAVEEDPESVAGHSGLARIYFARRELDRARRHFERSLSLKPDNAAAHNNLGVIAAIERDFARAITHFEAALAIDPDYEEARKNLERAREAS